MTIINFAYTCESELNMLKELINDTDIQIQNKSNNPLALSFIDGKLVLNNYDLNLNMSVDFLSSEAQRKINKNEAKLALVKAIEGRKKGNLSIIDATAGLGGDSFSLAARGHIISAIEASPIVFCLLKDGLKRALEDEINKEIACKIKLFYGDAIEVIPTLHKHDVIYLDPMFPEKKKSAKVKKNMQLLQYLLGHSRNDTKLFKVAKQCSKSKIIIKRAKTSDFIANSNPSSQIVGKSNRFDIYL